MSYLSRENASLPVHLWEQIDNTVVAAAKRVLTGRRFLSFCGPLGIGVQSINVDDISTLEEKAADGLSIIKGRQFVQIPTLYSDFTIMAKDLESDKEQPQTVSVPVATAAQKLALKEDTMIFLGDKATGYEGLLTAAGCNKIKVKDWKIGENAYSDLVAAMELLVEKGIYGSYALVISLDIFLQLQRLQVGTGILEFDRIAKLLDGHIFKSPVLGKNRAVLLGTDAANMDLVVGQDIATAYLEQKDMNHCFRILETSLLRIKRRQAIVVFE